MVSKKAFKKTEFAQQIALFIKLVVEIKFPMM